MTDGTSDAQVRMAPTEKALILIDQEAMRE